MFVIVFFFSNFFPFSSNDVNVTDKDGNTALHLAAISSKTECMRVLLRAGATDSLSQGMYPMGIICTLTFGL